MNSANQADRFRFSPVGLYASAVLSGMGAVLIGALLPSLARMERLDDRQSGLLIGVQFLGNFLGAISISDDLSRSLHTGQLASAAGVLLAAAAVTASAPVGVLCVCLLAFGFGLGQTITAANLIVGAGAATGRFVESQVSESRPGAPRSLGGQLSGRARGRAAQLSLLNLLWGLGAMALPLVAALSLSRISLPAIFLVFGLLFLLPCAFLAREDARAGGSVAGLVAPPATARFVDFQVSESRPGAPRFGRIFLCFAVIFFLYGGTENSLSGWLSTYSQRYASAQCGANQMVMAQMVTAAFWGGINVGRAAGAVFLRRISERDAIRLAIGSFTLCVCLLLRAHSSAITLALAAACGFCLSPIFPAALSWLVGLEPSPRRIGFILALCGLGGATLPALVGAASFHAGSLRRALALPIVFAVGMLLASPSRRMASGQRG